MRFTWNAGIQHSFRNDYTVDLRYIGTKGVHLLYQNQINRAALVTPTSNLPTYLQAPSQATLDSLKISTASLTALRTSTTDPTSNYLLPYGFNNPITAYVPRGNSNYHGLAVGREEALRQELAVRSRLYL